nr:uncharacterized protein LOC113728258 [Coffea arabica]
MVRKHMMHGPCGSKNPNNVCMQGKRVRFCKNKYPKQWAPATTHGQNAYPIYRRRNDGKAVHVRGLQLDNRWVVPYNPYLLAKFNCHINVEICSTIKVVKYMFKYIFKGHDKIHFRLNSDTTEQYIDEIKEYQTARWVSGIEAMWRIYRFSLNEMHPSVMNLQLHLPNYQPMSFKDDEDIRDVLKNPFKKKTMLTEFFYMNATDDLAKALKCTYKEFPEHFVWHPDKKYWSARKQKDSIGRIVAANPSEGDRYFLRLLLVNVKGPTSFDHLKIIDGQYAASFQEAAILRGYFESNNAQEQCLQEAALYHMPHTFRRLFATLLVHFPPANPRQLWQNFESSLSEDFYQQTHTHPDQIRLHVLHEISKFLQSMGKNINSYDLVPRILKFDQADRETRDTISEAQITVSDEDIASITRLNIEQKLAFDTITAHVYNNCKGSFFLDGSGGTGKTFLYKALLADIRSKGFIALATASSGVAASILPGGRTAHSRFKIPINMDINNMCIISKQSALAGLLRQANLIIWDEAPMMHKTGIEGVDKLLRDLIDTDDLFGDKVIVFGGDFRQVLPVVTKGSKADFMQASLINSYIWPQLQKLKLKQNMRALADPHFTDYLLRIGDGTESFVCNNNVQIPKHLVIPYNTEEQSLNELIHAVFPDLKSCSQEDLSWTNRAILTTKNEFVDDINNTLIEEFSGNTSEYISRDKITDTSQ